MTTRPTTLTAHEGMRANGLPQKITEPFTGDVTAWIYAGAGPGAGGARPLEDVEASGETIDPDRIGVELFAWGTDPSGMFAERWNVRAFLRNCTEAET